MKTLVLSAATALMALGSAGAASAYYFTPNNTNFTATGSVTLTAAKSHVCTATLAMNTNGNGLTITAATFKGRYCGGVTAANLPWKAFPKEPHTVAIDHMTLMTPYTTCGGGQVVYAGLSAGGRIGMSGARLGQCSVSGSLGTSPMLTVTGKAKS